MSDLFFKLSFLNFFNYHSLAGNKTVTVNDKTMEPDQTKTKEKTKSREKGIHVHVYRTVYFDKVFLKIPKANHFVTANKSVHNRLFTHQFLLLKGKNPNLLVQPIFLYTL